MALIIDQTAPAISGASVSDIIMTLTYTEASTLDAVNKAGAGAFTVNDVTNSSTITTSSSASQYHQMP